MRIPIKLTALTFTFLVTLFGCAYAWVTRDTTIVIVGLGIVGGVVGANAVCDYKDRESHTAGGGAIPPPEHR